jgi:Flp pilus assembly protein TadD
MTQETARTMLGLSAGAGVAESRQGYERFKAQLEESLRRAPTPSLQAKYRQRLNEVEEAYTCLQNVGAGAEGTAGTENLPYLRKIAAEQEPAPQPQEATLPKAATGRVEPKPQVSRALIAALVGLLTVGAVAGWWFGVEQPRREAEKQRAAAMAEAQRHAEDQQRQKELADAKAKAEEAERQRREAESKAQAIEVQRRVEEQQRLAQQKDEEEKRRLAAFTDAFNRASRELEEKQYEAAVADYTEAIRLKPDDSNAYMCRGGSYAGLKRYEMAISDYTEGIRLKPDDSNLYDFRGFAYAALGAKSKAQQDHKKANQLRGNR